MLASIILFRALCTTTIFTLQIITKGSSIIFSIFARVSESTLGEGVNSVVCFQNATVPVHETSLANQHFYGTLSGRGYV